MFDALDKETCLLQCDNQQIYKLLIDCLVLARLVTLNHYPQTAKLEPQLWHSSLPLYSNRSRLQPHFP